MATVTGDRSTTTTSSEESAFWEAAPRVLAMLNAATGKIAASDEVPPEAQEAVRTLADQVVGADALAGADPYLSEALLSGIVECLRTLWLTEDSRQARRELRLPLERVRQALRDLLEGRATAPDRPLRDVARWLADESRVSQGELARLLGVSVRTFQRWMSAAGETAPTGREAKRLVVVARVVDQLRWTTTGVGAVEWFFRPNPFLSGREPRDVLDEVDALERLTAAATALRAMVAG